MYTVSFETNGGGVIPSRQVEEDSHVFDIATPSKENYDFVGGDATLEARWKVLPSQGIACLVRRRNVRLIV